MRVGIVGHEGAKFTPVGYTKAQAAILDILVQPGVTTIVSGACHLGGIDVWAAKIGRELGLEVIEYPPRSLNWSSGYKERNILIARRSDILHNIVVDCLPPDYTGMVFKSCYHCGGATDHVKSGGCWTAKYAERLGKQAEWHIIHQ